jgi:capsular polysaccharide transport system permease protein
LRSVTALVLREMSTRYGRSPGGYIWALLEPLGAILVLSIGFSLLLRSPPLGNSFLLFYATGMTPFNLYQVLSRTVSRALGYSRALLVYPVVTWFDAVVARIVLNTLTNTLVGFILLGAILALIESRATLAPGPILLSMGLAMLVGIAVGLLNCVLNAFFPVWSSIWGILTRPLFIISGVIFLYEDMPPLAQSILWWNPLMHVLALMRVGFYPMYEAEFVSVAYVLGVTLPMIALGLVLLERYHKDILNQ